MSGSVIDLRWMGRPGLIGSWRVDDVLIDCGPSTTLPTLLEALGDWRPRAILLTHIHFDHAGAVGALVERWPEVEVIVHRAGARHLIDPSRLWASARRVFGDELEHRFGEMRPVPAERVRALDGGERIAGFEVAATPGHAVHHLAYLHAASGRAFVGDVCGVVLDGGPVLPPTPPPDVALEDWKASLALVAAWGPVDLALSHYGLVEAAAPHIAALSAALDEQERAALGGEEAYVGHVRASLAEACTPAQVDDYGLVVPFVQNYRGLRRALDAAAA
jgi:glyoxylase-like metal-dependent hydrolase (beta-lactamase superfamily II)